MTNRTLLALTFATAVAADLRAQTPRYAPGDFKYTALTVTKQTQTLGDQKQNSTVTLEQRLSLVLGARGPDSLRYRMKLDSNTMSADLPIQLTEAPKMQGTLVEGVMTATGRMGHFTFHAPPGASEGVAAVAQNLANFLIPLAPAHSTGTQWSDTVLSNQKNGGSSLDERTITTTSLEGDTVYNGARALKVRRELTYTAQGTMVQNNSLLDVTEEATGSGTYYVSAQGVFLGSRSLRRAMSTIKLPDGRLVLLEQQATVVIGLAP
jgi:hypothetical protein